MSAPNQIWLERGAVRSGNAPAMHSHDHCELFFLLSGQRRYFVDHSVYQVEPGDLVIIPPARLHRATRTGGSDYRRYLLNFYPRQHEEFLRTMGQSAFDTLLSGCCLHFSPEVSRRVRQSLEQLEQLMAQSEPIQAMVEHLLHDILFQALCFGVKKEPYHGERSDKVQQVAHYISRQYHQPITLHDAAAMATMEPTYFSRQFKALTGFGFHHYLTHTRLRAAEQLLANTSLTMGQVAEQCGFSDANHFGNVFRQWKGCSPTHYRREHKR